jgi:hypothetical protein
MYTSILVATMLTVGAPRGCNAQRCGFQRQARTCCNAAVVQTSHCGSGCGNVVYASAPAGIAVQGCGQPMVYMSAPIVAQPRVYAQPQVISSYPVSSPQFVNILRAGGTCSSCR